jgi:molybdenum cofactor cytidylyltransferase
VLAAGGSRRLGRSKQLVRHRGVALVVAACRRALATGPAGVVVVTGAQASRVAAAVRGLPVVIARNRAWRSGLAGSLGVGLRRVPASAPSVLVTTVDQWCVTTADLECLLRTGAPAAAGYDGARGVPALLPRAWRARVGALRGDRGARALLDGPEVRVVPMARAAVDLDTGADLRALRATRSGIRQLASGTRS